jgi:hypothetical protein
VTGATADPPAPAAAPSPDFEQTVPRWLVHRRAVSEVFVCGSAPAGPDGFAVAVQLPRAHTLWSDRRAGFHDPLMAVEAGRQATIMVSHAHYGVPRGLMMVARSSTMRVLDLEAFRDDGTNPLEGWFLMRLIDRRLHDGTPVGLTIAGDLMVGAVGGVGGSKAMSMTGTLVFTPQDDYDLLRAQARARRRLVPAPPHLPVAPELVGRRFPGNVVVGEYPSLLGETGPAAERPLIVDPANPAFFDHPLDHVPGQLLLEAGRQSAILAAVEAGALPGPDCLVTSCGVAFDDFVELDAEAECAALVGPPADDAGTATAVSVRVSLRQAGRKLGDIDIGLAPRDAGGPGE